MKVWGKESEALPQNKQAPTNDIHMTDVPLAQKRSIMLVDDDKFLLDMYSMKFTQAGFQVQACLSVKAALEMLRGGYQPNAILFDLIMPVEDGFSFLDTLQKEKLAPDALRIALTNQSDDVERKRAEERGAQKYIIKASMIPSEVVTAVGEEIAKHG